MRHALAVEYLNVLYTTDRRLADTDSFVAILNNARGVWFDGGRHYRLKAVTKTEQAADKAAAKNAKAYAKQASAATKAADKSDRDATGAIAQCKDGTYSHAKSTRGA